MIVIFSIISFLAPSTGICATMDRLDEYTYTSLLMEETTEETAEEPYIEKASEIPIEETMMMEEDGYTGEDRYEETGDVPFIEEPEYIEE